MIYNVLGKTGFRVSKLGLGGAPFGDIYGKTSDEETSRVIHAAMDLGVNFLDTAPLYGKGESERRIGLALKGGKRKQVILATKLVYPGESYDYEGSMASVRKSLALLQTDYLDLIQIHDVEKLEFEAVMDGTVRALHELREKGAVRAIGVTTRDLALLMRYMRTGVFDTIQFYNRYTLLDYTARDEVLPLASSMNLGVINGSTLAMGILADHPAAWLNPETVKLAQERMEQLHFLRRQETCGLVEPALRFTLAHPEIHVSLTGTASVELLEQNASYCDGQGLSKQEEAQVLSLFPGQKLFS